MTDYKINAEWRLKGDDFAPDIYNRDHILDFGNQNRLCASATPKNRTSSIGGFLS
ncbi:MAG: hypothetical protein WBM07_05115 [Chitinivibrionales bacterium]